MKSLDEALARVETLEALLLETEAQRRYWECEAEMVLPNGQPPTPWEEAPGRVRGAFRIYAANKLQSGYDLRHMQESVRALLAGL